MFGRFPSLPADPTIVNTGLQGRSDVHKRCGTGETYYEYGAAFAADNCVGTVESQTSGGERRRLKRNDDRRQTKRRLD
eukprot:3064269-Pleurochrysis_carterae.AAC.1